MEKNYKYLKFACYASNASMSVVSNLPPILFLTFREMYGVSFTLLGLLVLVNFVTQLTVDLILSFFSHKFRLSLCVKMIPILTIMGILVYSLAPYFFADNVYPWLVLGTVIFSAAAGFVEVLISPVIAALPAKDPDREMSKLHSVYAWGVVGVIAIATVFLKFVGARYWQILMLFFAIVPLCSATFFIKTDIPQIQTEGGTSNVSQIIKNKTLWLLVLAIFLGGSAECTMAQWSSGYLEGALGLPKAVGDIFGVALFGLTLGLGRTLYSKYGKNIEKVLFLGALSAFVCYLVCALCGIPVIGLIACAMTGFCTSMLWPGSLVVASDRIENGGVFLYAIMAAGGDLGASVGPQLIGIITDSVMANEKAVAFASSLGISAQSLGLKAGMLAGAVFPMLAIFVFLYILITKKTCD
ncbi:MAG: MFS transporter [Clostridia bacterium]|nr:MFS transporter [Clostridia bacterium]